jgi:hypothetical protein
MSGDDSGLQLLVFCDDTTTLWPLPGRVAVVGRGYDCEVRIDDTTVSRRHAELILPRTPQETPRLRDLGSRNGCRIARADLPPGTEALLPAGVFFEIGSIRCLLQRRVAGADQQAPTLDALETTDASGREGDAARLVDALVDASWQAPERALVVGPEAAWFRAHGREPIHLLRHRTMRLLLDRLVALRLAAPGVALSVDEAFAVGWPGERAIPGARQNRVYVMMHRLRKLGLSDLLLGRDDGYLLDVAVGVTRQPDRVARCG